MLICAALVFAACEKKSTLVGDWMLTDEVHGTHHVALEERMMLSFHEDKTGVMQAGEGESVRIEEFGWNLVNDTLVMFAKPTGQEHTGQDEPGMPGVYEVEKLTQEEMVMEHLIAGRIWYYFKRQ